MFRLAVFVLAALPLPALADGPDPAGFGEVFCAASIAGDMTPVEERLSPELALILEAALQRNAELQAAHPDEKPPLGDGIPWRSWPDYADGCTITAINHSATASGITIRYTFSSEPDASYEDTLIVVANQAGSDVVQLDDILFRDEQTLRGVLEYAASAEN